MNKYLVLIFLGFHISLSAQVSILISDETERSFKLGIDGYVQNTEPVEKLIIDKLDTNEHLLYFDIYGGDTIRIKRKLKLPENGKYQYVLSKNFEGTTQLRFRGKINDFPKGIISMDAQQISEWPKGEVVAVKEEKVIIPEEKDLPETDIVSAKNEKEKTAIENSEKTPVVLTEKPKQDTLIPKETPVQEEIPVPPAEKTFASLMEEIKGSEYEFNRLNTAKDYIAEKSLTATETATILREFRYDNTRLQFILYALEKISDPENMKEIENSFEYELSKQEFREKYLGIDN